jgi:hypothetical protein
LDEDFITTWLLVFRIKDNGDITRFREIIERVRESDVPRIRVPTVDIAAICLDGCRGEPPNF